MSKYKTSWRTAMKCNRLLLLILVVLLAAMTLGAVPTPDVCASDEVTRYDTNGDGALSKDEARIAWQEWLSGDKGSHPTLIVVYCHLAS